MPPRPKPSAVARATPATRQRSGSRRTPGAGCSGGSRASALLSTKNGQLSRTVSPARAPVAGQTRAVSGLRRRLAMLATSQ